MRMLTLSHRGLAAILELVACGDELLTGFLTMLCDLGQSLLEQDSKLE